MTLKERLFSNNKLILIALIFVQVLFLLFGFALLGAGHGTYTQFPVFYGWFVFPIVIGYYIKSLFVYIMFYILFVPIIFLFFSIKIFNKIRSREYKHKNLKLLMLIHFIGSFATIVLIEFTGDAPLTSDIEVKLIGFGIAAILSFLFWRIFFQLEKCANKKS